MKLILIMHGDRANIYDICVIGGGINGAGIARDCAGRGYKVLLVDQGDLGAATSSASTKLIHGGLRYLEYYEFGLVRSALREREVLLTLAPHIIWPLAFTLPHTPELRPAWMIRAGLFLYDFLGGFKKFDLWQREDAISPLKPDFKKRFTYSDCWVEDSRLVILNARDASRLGAEIAPRTTCKDLSPGPQGWQIGLVDDTGAVRNVSARMVVNATGPWVRQFLDDTGLSRLHNDTPSIRMVKGSHIIIEYDGAGEAYLLQQPDGRVVFSIPYEYDYKAGQFAYTLIGTTDVEYEGNPANIRIDADEIDYLCRSYNSFMQHEITKEDVISTYSGVRPLMDEDGDDASSLSRDYYLYMRDYNGCPMLSVFGGKITTYRVLAEKVAAMVQQKDGDEPAPWTRDACLPGGDILLNRDPGRDYFACFNRFVQNAKGRYAFLPGHMCERLARTYGTDIHKLLEGAGAIADLGRHYGDDVYEAEIRYLIAHEWARTSDDILWRRTKLGLHLDADAQAHIDEDVPRILRELDGKGEIK